MAILVFISFFTMLSVAQNEVVQSDSTPALESETSPGASQPVAPTSCTPLAPGASITVEDSSESSPTGVARAYKLTRSATDPQRYIAEFNLLFSPNDEAIEERYQGQAASPNDLFKDSPQGTRTDEMRAALIVRTRECFQQTQGQLRTSDGTLLELRLSAHDDPHPPRRVSVQINTAAARSNASSWARQIQCPTIIHEVFHLMGLCDGYRETVERTPDVQILARGGERMSIVPQSKIEPSFMYNCRSLEPRDSIMTDQFTALQQLLEIRVCSRLDNSLPISQSVSELPASCPDGSPGQVQIASQRDYMNRIAQRRQRATYYYRVLPARGQTIYPAQMRLITQPHCNARNQRYIDCSQNAYRTLQIEGCANVPSFCSTGDFMN